MIHYDGVAWSQLTTGFEADGDHITGLWGAGTGTVYAITNVSGSLLVFDGSTWSMVATGLPALNAIWGSAEDDVHLAADGALLHWDGQSVTPLLGR